MTVRNQAVNHCGHSNFGFCGTSFDFFNSRGPTHVTADIKINVTVTKNFPRPEVQWRITLALDNWKVRTFRRKSVLLGVI